MVMIMMIKMSYSESCRRCCRSASVFSSLFVVTTFFLLSLLLLQLGKQRNNGHHNIMFVESWSYSPNNNAATPMTKLMTTTTSRQRPSTTTTTALFGMYDNPANPNPITNPNNSNDKNIIDDDEYMEIANLTLNQIIELIELSFFQGCYALSKGNTEPLKMFIVAVQTFAYKQQNEHIDNQDINYVDSNGDSSITVSTMSSMITNPLNGRTSPVRPLEEQEMDLRDTWIHAICLMTTHVVSQQEQEQQKQQQKQQDGITSDNIENDDDNENENNENDDTDTDIAIKVKMIYGPILNDLIAIHQSKLGLNVNQFIKSRKEILFPTNNGDDNENENEKESSKIKKENNNNNILALDNDDSSANSNVVDENNNDIDIDPMEYAVVAQTINVLYNTLEVLSDEEDAIVIDDADAVIEEEITQTPSSSKRKKSYKKKQSNSSSSSSSSSGKGFGA
jgi:hypothetical protein